MTAHQMPPLTWFTIKTGILYKKPTHMSVSEGQGGFTNLGLPLGFGTFTSVANYTKRTG